MTSLSSVYLKGHFAADEKKTAGCIRREKLIAQRFM